MARGRAVIDLHAGIQPRLAGGQAHADHALHAVKRLVFAHPNGHSAAFLALDGHIHGHERAGAVVAGPVELHAAGDPAAQQPDERGLDDVLLVEEIIPGALVQRGVDAPADFGHQLHAQVFVFQRDDAEGALPAVRPVHCEHGLGGVRVAAGALVHAVFRKQRQLLGGREAIGGQHAQFIGDDDGIHSQTSL